MTGKMIDANEVDYAAIITIELPGMDRPATVTLTLKPPDAVEVAPGQVKPLRECTLSDLQAFADALEAELWEQYRTMTLTQLATTEDIALKITILGEADEPLSAAQERWLAQATAEEDIEGKAAGGQSEGTTQQFSPQTAQETAQEAAQIAESKKSDEAQAVTEPEQDDVPAEDDDESTREAVAEEAVPPTAEQKADTEETPAEETPDADTEKAAPMAHPEDEEASSEVAEEAPSEVTEEVAELGPPPIETPVVEGAEPATAPVAAPPSDDGVRVAGLRRPPGHSTPAAADILINEPAFRTAQEHALSSLSREVAGMLVGPQPEKQPDGRYLVHITDVIAAKHTRMSGASVTYTPESWRYVSDVLDERYPDGEAIIVGWYHTHPGFGIFLSGMDLFIHQNFFTQTWHVALVLDPQAERSGFFCWNRQQTAVQPYDFPWPCWAAASW